MLCTGAFTKIVAAVPTDPTTSRSPVGLVLLIPTLPLGIRTTAPELPSPTILKACTTDDP